MDSAGISEFRPASPCKTTYTFNWKEKTLKATDLTLAYLIDRQGTIEKRKMQPPRTSEMYQYNVPQILIMYPDGTGSRLLTELDIALYEKDFTKFGGVVFDDCIADKVVTRTLMKAEDGAVFYREVLFLFLYKN